MKYRIGHATIDTTHGNISIDAPQAYNEMRPQDWVHVGSVIQQHGDLTRDKYANGRKEHGGDCWAKPGMLSHALDESSDLSVYLWTLRQQLLDLANECDREGHALIAEKIRYVVHK